MRKMLFFWFCATIVLSVSAVGQGSNFDDLTFSGGAASWLSSDGLGLIGPFVEIEQQSFSLDVGLGIGTNRVQGWGLWPRMYLGQDVWRPFGEFALIQLSETEIQIDPSVGLIKNTFTSQFVALGVGVRYQQEGRFLSGSMGFGVNGGQCLHCGAHAYARVSVGVAF